jgi:hypothetical protein
MAAVANYLGRAHGEEPVSGVSVLETSLCVDAGVAAFCKPTFPDLPRLVSYRCDEGEISGHDPDS